MNVLFLCRTLFRSPVKTVLIFILLGVVSSVWIVQICEYIITKREYDNAAVLYRGVGAVEVAAPVVTDSRRPGYFESDPRMSKDYTDHEKKLFYQYTAYRNESGYILDDLRYRSLRWEQITAFSGLPFIDLFDVRYMTAGISDKYYRLDEGEGYYNYSARLILEGVLTEVSISPPPPDPTRGYQIKDFHRLSIENYKFLAGNSPYVTKLDKLSIYSNPYTPSNVQFWDSRGRTSFIYLPNYVYHTEFIKTLVPGHRYVFVLRFDPLDKYKSGIRYPILSLSDHLSDSWCAAVWNIEGESDGYLELEKYSPLRTLIELTEADTHTFDVVYTVDMDAIFRFAEENMTIIEGRALTSDDNESAAPLCVISREFALEYNLCIGDTLTFKLGTELFEQYKGLGAQAISWQRYRPPLKPVALKIIGIYADTDSKVSQKKNPNWNYSLNTIFVPKALLPIDENTIPDHEFSPAEFSFILDSAWNTSEFLEEAESLCEVLGLRLIFNDKGWMAIENEFRITGWISFINITAVSVTVIMIIGCTVYYFVSRQKRVYAILRALGASKKEAAARITLPLMTINCMSILSGSVGAWFFINKAITENNTLVTFSDFSARTTVPGFMVALCVIGELSLTLVCASILLWRIGKESPLALLQSKERGIV
ncbi:MAG: ABC transporter permease [Clostridiales bacterium]|nr:ABC transporter permease [Clostridiales bacterium]